MDIMNISMHRQHNTASWFQAVTKYQQCPHTVTPTAHKARVCVCVKASQRSVSLQQTKYRAVLSCR